MRSFRRPIASYVRRAQEMQSTVNLPVTNRLFGILFAIGGLVLFLMTNGFVFGKHPETLSWHLLVAVASPWAIVLFLLGIFLFILSLRRTRR